MSNFKSIHDLVQNSHSFSKISYDLGIKELNKLNIEFTPGQVVLVGSRPSALQFFTYSFIFIQITQKQKGHLPSHPLECDVLL